MSSPLPLQENLSRDRLPTLSEVLSQRTLAPVELFSFYIYMRDQQRSVDYLDFWLDVAEHSALYRHYVRESQQYVLPDAESDSLMEERYEPKSENDTGNLPARPPRRAVKISIGSNAGQSNSTPEGTGNPYKKMAVHLRGGSDYKSAFPRWRSIGSERGEKQNLGLDLATSRESLVGVSRQDIQASAEKILYTYLLPGAEREIILPTDIAHYIVTAIEEVGRSDLDVFDDASVYIFQAMERDAFPGFLRAKALGNLIPLTLRLQMVIGILSLFAGLWAAFVLIFLDISLQTRIWLILPFTLGIYFLISFEYALDPILALLHLSEYTFMNFGRVREPFVLRLHTQRARFLLAMVIVIDAGLSALFIFVPGRRL